MLISLKQLEKPSVGLERQDDLDGSKLPEELTFPTQQRLLLGVSNARLWNTKEKKRLCSTRAESLALL